MDTLLQRVAAIPQRSTLLQSRKSIEAASPFQSCEERWGEVKQAGGWRLSRSQSVYMLSAVRAKARQAFALCGDARHPETEFPPISLTLVMITATSEP
jgi:hypothetical protein